MTLSKLSGSPPRRKVKMGMRVKADMNTDQAFSRSFHHLFYSFFNALIRCSNGGWE